MPKLVLSKDGEIVREYIVDTENTLIGRSQECDLTVADDNVSRQHLRVICMLGDCFLEDMNSANGTLVNNRLTKKCPLEDGDTISLGQHNISYDAARYNTISDDEFDKIRIQLIKQLGEPDRVAVESDQSPEVPPPPYPHTSTAVTEAPVEINSAPDSEFTETSIQKIIPKHGSDLQLGPEKIIKSRTRAENPKTRTGNLKIINGARKGHNMALSRPVTGINKAGQRVAAITRRQNGYFLVPLGDNNTDNINIIVNGCEVDRKIFPLWSNDIIKLGETEMEFLFED